MDGRIKDIGSSGAAATAAKTGNEETCRDAPEATAGGDDGGDDNIKTGFAGDAGDEDHELTDDELAEAAAIDEAAAEAAEAAVDAIDPQIPFTTVGGECDFSEGDRVNLRIQETVVVVDVLTCNEDRCTGKVVIDNDFLTVSAGIPYGSIVKFSTANVISVG